MKEFFLVSVKSKTDQTFKVHIIEKGSIGDFIASNLTADVVILIDSAERLLNMLIGSFESIVKSVD